MVFKRHRLGSLLAPLITDSKGRSLLAALTNLAQKLGHKILLSKNIKLLDRYRTIVNEGVGVEWEGVRIHQALRSNKVLKLAVKQWGGGKWQSRWQHMDACRQTKTWFPTIQGDLSHHIRRLNRLDLGRLIHFTSGHNHLRRHRFLLGQCEDETCRLCGDGREDANHLWSKCSGTQHLVEGRLTMGPHSWSPFQLSRFLQEPLIAELMDHPGVEQMGSG